MSLIQSTAIPSGASDYEIDQSLRFDNSYLTFIPSQAPTNDKIGTWNFWFKKCNVGDNEERTLFSSRNAAGAIDHVNCSTNYDEKENSITFLIYNGNIKCHLVTTADYRDPSAWYNVHIAYDSTQGTASNRVKMYVNGEQVTQFTYEVYPAQNQELRHWVENGRSCSIGTDFRTSAMAYLQGYLADFHYLDGQVKAPTDFAETGDYGEWKPIKYAGAYGDNGFYLDFKSSGVGTAGSGTVGADRSGNGNHLTSAALAVSDQMLDTPTNNFCTMNILDEESGTFSEGNLKVSIGTSGNRVACSTMAPSSGKWYVEMLVKTIAHAASGIGVCGLPFEAGLTSPYGYSDSALYYAGAGAKYVDGGGETSYGATFGAGDIIGVALNIDDNEITFYKNNSAQPTISKTFTGQYKFVLPNFTGSGTQVYVINFGQDSLFGGEDTDGAGATDANSIGDFYYAPPSGFLALCTKNLPEPAVIPSEHFNTVLFTGNGSTQTVTGTGFQPDWVWNKSRNSTHGHALFDAVRGGAYRLASESTQEGRTNEGNIAFTSDGFNVTASHPTVNNSNSPMVSWNWKANGSGTAVSESGSGNNCVNASTHSANAAAGFSIVKYVGRKDELSNGQHSKVTHGMGSNSPELIIIKNRDAGDDWMVIGDGLNTSSDWDHRHLNLNNTAAKSGSDYSGATVPNSTHFFISNADSVNTTDENYIAYCFASVDGYSEIGSYTGNGNVDGTFVYTGFRPAFIMFKNINAVGSWHMYDTKRNTSNVSSTILIANANNVEESDSSYNIDILSNGFKQRTTSDITNDGSYLYLAFAETPFKYSNGR